MVRIVMTVLFIILTLWSTVSLWRGDWVASLPFGQTAVPQAPVENKNSAQRAMNNKRMAELEHRLAALDEGVGKKIAKVQQRLEWLNYQMVSMDGGSLDVDRTDPKWRLDDIFSKRRVFEQEIRFKQPFSAPPQVILGLRHLSVGEQSLNLVMVANKVQADGFILRLETRSDERLRAVGLDWTAFSSPAKVTSRAGELGR
ncbi:MAG: H-type lectin domain-containing protein [Magnetococcales bacterium]|nr:H-type lectin domain-containing protein [Magnetococcales bacterium]